MVRQITKFIKFSPLTLFTYVQKGCKPSSLTKKLYSGKNVCNDIPNKITDNKLISKYVPVPTRNYNYDHLYLMGMPFAFIGITVFSVWSEDRLRRKGYHVPDKPLVFNMVCLAAMTVMYGIIIPICSLVTLQRIIDDDL